MTTRSLSRRVFFQAVGAAGVSGIARAASGASGHGTGRKMTMDLVCGNLGVKADLPMAINLAHQNGFESVAPDAGYLGQLSDSQLSDFVADLKGKGLTWASPDCRSTSGATTRPSGRGWRRCPRSPRA